MGSDDSRHGLQPLLQCTAASAPVLFVAFRVRPLRSVFVRRVSRSSVAFPALPPAASRYRRGRLVVCLPRCVLRPSGVGLCFVLAKALAMGGGGV